MDNSTKPTELAFNEENERRLQRMLPHYPTREAALIPALHLALDQFGSLSEAVMEYVAGRLELPPSKVLAVQSFYTMLNREPLGKYNLQVCRTLSCALKGSDEIIAHLEKRLGVKCGHTTPDGKFTLSTAECLASCGTAPVLQVNLEPFDENLTTDMVEKILERCR